MPILLVPTANRPEREEEQALAAWRAREVLFRDLVAWALARAPRCTRCARIAFWRATDRRYPGAPKDTLLCDEHRRAVATDANAHVVAIEGGDVVRRALNSTR